MSTKEEDRGGKPMDSNLMVCFYREYLKHFETFQAQKSNCTNRGDCSTKSICRIAKNVVLQVMVRGQNGKEYYQIMFLAWKAFEVECGSWKFVNVD